MTALNEEELDVIFEHYTQARQVENFNQYFAQKAEKDSEQDKQPVQEAPAQKPEKREFSRYFQNWKKFSKDFRIM